MMSHTNVYTADLWEYTYLELLSTHCAYLVGWEHFKDCWVFLLGWRLPFEGCTKLQVLMYMECMHKTAVIL